MKKINSIALTYNEFDTTDELDPADRELSELALKSAATAYAPYSGFMVGAAVRLVSGTIVCGSNVENAAFPSGVCAERNAIANAVSNHQGDNIAAIAVAALSSGGLTAEPVTPCGNCRQVISEEEARNGQKIRIILTGKNKILVIEGIDVLLPLHFNAVSLRAALP